MDSQRLQYFEKIDCPKHKEFIDSLSHCVLCGSVLELKHTKSDEDTQIREEAHCPQCEIKTRAKIFALN
jgi:hypothetical protein